MQIKNDSFIMKYIKVGIFILTPLALILEFTFALLYQLGYGDTIWYTISLISLFIVIILLLPIIYMSIRIFIFEKGE